MYYVIIRRRIVSFWRKRAQIQIFSSKRLDLDPAKLFRIRAKQKVPPDPDPQHCRQLQHHSHNWAYPFFCVPDWGLSVLAVLWIAIGSRVGSASFCWNRNRFRIGIQGMPIRIRPTLTGIKSKQMKNFTFFKKIVQYWILCQNYWKLWHIEHWWER